MSQTCSKRSKDTIKTYIKAKTSDSKLFEFIWLFVNFCGNYKLHTLQYTLLSRVRLAKSRPIKIGDRKNPGRAGEGEWAERGSDTRGRGCRTHNLNWSFSEASCERFWGPR